ncbi:flagellar basal body-associated protein FliL [Noviherbaspirillum soli]|uniref:flagellar basal body-associated protein FliL n=1 Tax=Noviherbaspirillum soli TaxID=1064518 RepID=UPI00188AD248|nr:flagellar basal body-associated protein FliL [Noviherbaspirillum soli]
MATSKAAAKPAQAEGGAKSKSKLFIIIGAAVVLLGAGGGGAWYFLGHKNEAQAEAAPAKAAPAAPPVFAQMDPFTVNLQADGGEQFLQTAFTLQVGSQADVDAIKLYLPQVRSRVLLLLSSKRSAEISTVEGKKKLAEEIIAQLKQPFAAGGQPLNVSDVFFTAFVIQ